MGSKTYVGYPSSPRVPGDVAVFVATEDGPEYLLPHIVKHSPTGFEWGYAGSGPADLAYAILVDYLDDAAKVEDLYQNFKRAFIERLSRDHSWIIEAGTVGRWIERHTPTRQESSS